MIVREYDGVHGPGRCTSANNSFFPPPRGWIGGATSFLDLVTCRMRPLARGLSAVPLNARITRLWFKHGSLNTVRLAGDAIGGQSR